MLLETHNHSSQPTPYNLYPVSMTDLQPQVILSQRGLERLQSRHPWIYKSDLERLPQHPGLYPVQDRRGRVYGWAAVNPLSEISVRMLSYGDAEIGRDFLVGLLERSLNMREALHIQDEGYRLVHGEADGLPGLIVDRYAGTLVMQSGSAALEPFLPDFLELLISKLNPSGILARFENKSRALEGLDTFVKPLYGVVDEELEVHEANLRYLVNPYTGQKTGAFLDQRLNRQTLGRYARGDALDVFSYHAAFGLHLAGKVRSLECIDSSVPALERAQQIMELNGYGNVRYIEANAFDYLRALESDRRQFDTISLDPPALAKLRKDLPSAYRAYKELNLRCIKMLAPGGVLASSSCSFHVNEPDFYAMLEDAARDAGRRLRILERGTQAPDHPELLGVPETRYLKFALLQALD